MRTRRGQYISPFMGGNQSANGMREMVGETLWNEWNSCLSSFKQVSEMDRFSGRLTLRVKAVVQEMEAFIGKEAKLKKALRELDSFLFEVVKLSLNFLSGKALKELGLFAIDENVVKVQKVLGEFRVAKRNSKN